MVNLQPYDFQKKTNIKEHNDIVDKINEIVEVINASDLENVGTDITELEGKVATLENTTQSQATEISNNTNDISTLETEITAIKSKDTEQDEKISTLEGTVSAQGATIGTLESTVSSQGTRIGTLETSQSSQDTKISTLESNQTSQGSKITALETSQGTQDNKITAIENIQNTLAVASTLSTTEHTDTEKIGISIDSQNGQTNKVAYIPIATPSSIGLMSATDKSNLDNLVSNPPVTEIPVATSTVLGGVKVGANLSITSDGVLSATGGGGTGADLPLHTVGSNDESVLVQVEPVTTNGNVVLRTTYKDYKNDGTIQTKQDDSANFPTATTNGPGMMAPIDKTKLDSIPDASTIALKSEIPDTSQLATKREVQTVQTNLSDFEAELISNPSTLVGLASSARSGLMPSGDKTKLDGMPASGDIALKSELSALTGELMNTPADVVGMATGSAGGLMSASDKTKMDAIPSADTIATDADVSRLKLSEVSPNGIALNGDSVTVVRSVAGSVSGSNLTVNVNGVASQPIALPSGGNNFELDDAFDSRDRFFTKISKFISNHSYGVYSVSIIFAGGGFVTGVYDGLTMSIKGITNSNRNGILTDDTPSNIVIEPDYIYINGHEVTDTLDENGFFTDGWIKII